MRPIDGYRDQNDEFFHPLWLGMLILFCVMTIVGFVCCLRIKCGTQLRIISNRLFGRKKKKPDSSLSDDKSSTMSYSYNWPSIYTTSRAQSPKLYTLIKHIQTTNLEKQLSLKQQSIPEDETETQPSIEPDHPQLSLPPSTDDNRSSEVARKFYASMRNSSQCQNSSSVDSYNNDASLSSTSLSLTTDQPIKSKRQKDKSLLHISRFFQSTPNADGLVVII